jgi:2-amino-4-hydroxy-6-hydroxymethyldihydropteridine diphosphokinase
LRTAQELEASAERVRGQRWGPRTLDVDLVSCSDGGTEVFSRTDGLTLPHPMAHLRAFVLIPWLAVDPGATLTVGREIRPVARLLGDIDAVERDGVRLTGQVLHVESEPESGRKHDF